MPCPTRFSDRLGGHISVQICCLQIGLRSEPSRVEGTPDVPKSETKRDFFDVIPAFVQWCKRRGKLATNVRNSSSTIFPLSLTSAPSASGPMTPEMSRHPRSTDSL